MKEKLQIERKVAVDIVEKWPGILGIDIYKSLNRLNSSLSRVVDLNENNNTKTYKKPYPLFMSNVVKIIPRVLMIDISRKVRELILFI